MNLSYDLFLLTTHLTQLKSRDHLIQLFIESINNIFPDCEFEWRSDIVLKSAPQISVGTRTKTYGLIVFKESPGLNSESFALLQNSVQMLGVAIEKIEQDLFIADQRLHLQNLVAEKTKEYAALNEEYLCMNEELSDGNRKLRESEMRYRSISKLSSDFSYSCKFENGSFVVDWITDAFFSITGFDKEDLRRRGCWLFAAHPDDRQWITDKLSKLRVGTFSKDEFRLVSKTGTIHFIINNIECIEDQYVDEGKRFFGSVVDITDRKAAEAAVRNKAIELERFNNLMIGRELKMIELKQEVNTLLKRLGEPGKYQIDGFMKGI